MSWCKSPLNFPVRFLSSKEIGRSGSGINPGSANLANGEEAWKNNSKIWAFFAKKIEIKRLKSRIQIPSKVTELGTVPKHCLWNPRCYCTPHWEGLHWGIGYWGTNSRWVHRCIQHSCTGFASRFISNHCYRLCAYYECCYSWWWDRLTLSPVQSRRIVAQKLADVECAADAAWSLIAFRKRSIF